jgi:addiction module HigA family antidote
MIPKHNPIHPGEILREEFLEPLEIPQTKLAEQLGIPLQRVNEICTGKRGITAETAWLLSAAFKNTPQFWMNSRRCTTHGYRVDAQGPYRLGWRQFPA